MVVDIVDGSQIPDASFPDAVPGKNMAGGVVAVRGFVPSIPSTIVTMDEQIDSLSRYLVQKLEK